LVPEFILPELLRSAIPRLFTELLLKLLGFTLMELRSGYMSSVDGRSEGAAISIWAMMFG